MLFTVITENDKSQWKDETGIRYHFPSRYAKYLTPGTSVVYYKGTMKDNLFINRRLSPLPHYFGTATIGNISKDENSDKGDLFAEILNFQGFHKSVSFKQKENTIEAVPKSRTSNYWRNGVRPIDKTTYDQILQLAGVSGGPSNFNDEEMLNSGFESTGLDGGQKKKYTTYYERNPALRQQAVEIHGYDCKACGLNFKKKYGEWGEGFIHVHHIKPVSASIEKQIVNPHKDLVVLCANCHAMVHRKRDQILSIAELKSKLMQFA